MTGSLPLKLARLGAHLLTHPRYASRYWRHNVFHHPSPLELELPWFSYAAIDFLNGFIQPSMTIGEYGSGGSTIFFARRARAVYSVEDNPEWYERVCQALNQKNLPNAHVKLVPFDFKNPTGFEKSAYLNGLPEEPLDVIVIDGSEEWTQVRPVCFWHAQSYVKPGGVVIVDDSWRYPNIREKHRAKRHEIFQSAGPGRPGVTSTDVYFY